MKETPEQRSRIMQTVRSRDTGPEMVIRRFLHAAGLRYRLHDRRLPGTPDLVFPSLRLVLFVHGCFWHQYAECRDGRLPKSNTNYWEPKLKRNTERDKAALAELATLGWKTLVIWECEVKNAETLEKKIKEFLD